MTDERFETWRGGLAGFGDAVGFAVACVAEGLETVARLGDRGAGGEVVERREGEYKSWDAEILRVDKDVEDGFRRRLAARGEPVVLLSEEAGRVELGDGEPTAFAVADPFDGSWLFQRGVPDFWYSSLALYDAALRPICSAVGDAIHRVIAFADGTGAYRVPADGEGPGEVTKLDAGFRRSMGRLDVADPARAGIESYAMKPTKFLLPLVDRYRPVLEAFKFFLPNGGPYGFVDVAEGKVDVYFAPRQPFVDIFSGIGIAERADAIVTDFGGRPVAPADDPETLWDVVASTNQPLHDQVLELVSRCR